MAGGPITFDRSDSDDAETRTRAVSLSVQSDFVAGVAKPAASILSRDGLHRVAHCGFESLPCPGRPGAQKLFHLAPTGLDRVPLRGVAWEEDDPTSRTLDGCPDRGLFVGGQVVEDDHLARPQLRYQDLLDE